MGKQSTFPVIQELHIKWICAQLGNPRRKDCRVVGPLKYYKGGVAAQGKVSGIQRKKVAIALCLIREL